eukprot:scaffold123950_cov17-Tisochrysis_lutea.AAC.3
MSIYHFARHDTMICAVHAARNAPAKRRLRSKKVCHCLFSDQCADALMDLLTGKDWGTVAATLQGLVPSAKKQRKAKGPEETGPLPDGGWSIATPHHDGVKASQPAAVWHGAGARKDACLPARASFGLGSLYLLLMLSALKESKDIHHPQN